jgi:hypothetical protein
MSYDVCLEIDTGGPEPVAVADWNYTSNCAPMWRKAGADLREFDGQQASDCLPVLNTAITRMAVDRATYEAMEPSNGWGTYNTVLPALRALSSELAAHPEATVRVSW